MPEPVLVRPWPLLISPTFISVPDWKLSVSIGVLPPMLKPAMSSVPPFRVSVALPVPAARSRSQCIVTVPPVMLSTPLASVARVNDPG